MITSILLLILVLLAGLLISVLSLRKSALDLVSEQLKLQRAIAHELCPAFNALELNQQSERLTEYGQRFAELKYSVSPEDRTAPISAETRERMRDVSEYFAGREVSLMRFRFMVQANLAVARGEQTIVEARQLADKLDDSLRELLQVRPMTRDEDAHYGPTRFGVAPDAEQHLAEQAFRRWFDLCNQKIEAESQESQSSISAAGEAFQWVSQYTARRHEISQLIGLSGES